jgi:hypothetical protein
MASQESDSWAVCRNRCGALDPAGNPPRWNYQDWVAIVYSLSREYDRWLPATRAPDIQLGARASGLSGLFGNHSTAVWRCAMVVPMPTVPAPSPEALSATAGQPVRLPRVPQVELHHAEPTPEGQVDGTSAGNQSRFGRVRFTIRPFPTKTERYAVEDLLVS